MRNLLIVLSILIFLALIAIGGYTGLWFYNANNGKKAIAEYFKKIPNAKYESLKVSGFPLAYEYEIKKPGISFNSGEIMKEAFGKGSMQTGGAQGGINFPEVQWQDELYLEGSMLITYDAMIKNMRSKQVGDIHYKSKIGNATKHFISKNNPENKGVLIEFTKPILIEGLKNTGNSKNLELAKYFQKFEFNIGSQNIIDADSDKNLFTMSNEHVLYKRNQDNHRFVLSVKDAKFTDTADNFILSHPYINALIEHNGHVEEDMPSAKGKVNFSIDMSFKAKIDDSLKIDDIKQPTMAKMRDIDLEIKKFDYSDNFITSTFNAKALTKGLDKGKPTNAQLKLNSKVNVTEKYYLLQQKKFKQLADKYSAMVGAMAESKDAPEGLIALIKIREKGKALIPKMHKMGDITFNLDVDYTGNANGIPEKINVKAFDYVTDNYGVKMSSVLNYAKTPMPEDGQINIKLLNYRKMTDDIGAYLQNIVEIIKKTAPDEIEGFKLTDEVIYAFKSYLQSISDKPDEYSKDIQITIRKDKKSTLPKVGNMGAMQAAGLFQKNILSLFEPPPFEEGLYSCTCKKRQSSCFKKDLTTGKGTSHKYGELHEDILLKDVVGLYGPRRKGMLKTGWKCKYTGPVPPEPDIPIIVEEDDRAEEELSPRDAARLFRKYDRAARNGEAKAQYNLAVMFGRGMGTRKNEKKMMYWMKKSAKNGYTKAADNLEYMGFNLEEILQ